MEQERTKNLIRKMQQYFICRPCLLDESSLQPHPTIRNTTYLSVTVLIGCGFIMIACDRDTNIMVVSPDSSSLSKD